jgi:hypothetical protein
MSTLKVNAISDAAGANGNAITLATDGTCTAKITNSLSSRRLNLNGAMNVAQRATSYTITGNGGSQNDYRVVDRYKQQTRSDANWTYSQESDGPTGFANSFKALCTQADSAIAANVYEQFEYHFEGQDVQQLAKGTAAAKQFTVSFWVKSNCPGTYILEAIDEDNTKICCKTYTVPGNTNWNQFTLTFPADTADNPLDDDNAASLVLNWWTGAGSDKSSGTLQTTWGTKTEANRAVGQVQLGGTVNNYWQITGIQVEVGDTATDFEHRPYSYELARCQRYLQKWGNDGKYFAPGCTDSTTYGRWGVDLACPLRATPTVKTGGSEIRLYRDGDNKNSTNTPTVLKFTPNSTQIALAVDGYTSLTSQRIATFVFNGDNKNIYFSGDDTNLALEAEL